MKKLLILSLLFFSCSFCTKEYSAEMGYATTWSGTSLSQGITYTAMNNCYETYGGGSASSYYPWCDGGSIPSNSLRLLTKGAFATDYCNIGWVYVKNTGKASNAVLIKSDIGFIAYSYAASSSSDCGFAGSPTTIYISSDFTKAYSNSAQTTLFNGGGTGRMTNTICLVSGNYVYLVIDASGNVTTLISSTC